MTCPISTYATIPIVRRGGRMAIPRHLDTPSLSAPSGPAESIGIGLIAVGGRNIDLTARAVRMTNRDRNLTRRYLELHRTLASRTGSEGDA